MCVCVHAYSLYFFIFALFSPDKNNVFKKCSESFWNSNLSAVLLSQESWNGVREGRPVWGEAGAQ